MIKLLSILMLTISLYASQIIDYNIYERPQNVDMVIIFDTPYHGAIKQSIEKSKITIKLEKSFIKSSAYKKLSSDLINSLSIKQTERHTEVIANIKYPLNLKASKTSNLKGLRLRFSKTPALQTNQSKKTSSTPITNNTINKNYYIIGIILVIGFFILLFLRKQTPPSQKNQTIVNIPPNINNNNNVTIRFQKNINNENSVVMLDFLDQSYLILMGKSNILLDKFTDNKPTSQAEFESILESKYIEVDDFTQPEDNKIKKSLQAYTQRASTINYE